MDKTFQFKNQYGGAEVSIHVQHYRNGRPVIELIDVSDGQPYAVATVNMPEVLLSPNECLIKDYSENEGMYEFLVNNNIVTPSDMGIQLEHVWLPLAIINPIDQWGNKIVSQTKTITTDDSEKL